MHLGAHVFLPACSSLPWQMIDLDAENMAVLIDRQHCATKKVILDAVMEMKVGAGTGTCMLAQATVVPPSIQSSSARDDQVILCSMPSHAMQARMMTVQNAAVEEERRLGAQRLAAKQAEIDLLRFELNQAVQRGKKMGDVMSK